MKKVLVFGTFDCLHKGHKNFLKQAKENGNYLIVIVGTDKNVSKLKGKKPQQNQHTRLANLLQLELVDNAILGTEDLDFIPMIKQLQPDTICLGYDQNSMGLEKKTDIEIVRLEPYKKEKYKTSLMRPKC